MTTREAAMELTLLCKDDASALWAFETQHRDFFAHWRTQRPDSFYTPQGFDRALQAGLVAQATGHAFYYLLRVGGELVGRISLTQVRRTALGCATLSYRIAPAYSGQGLASLAVQQVMQKAFQAHGLQRLEATAHPDNSAAVRVLVKNGFQPFGHTQVSPQLHRPLLDQLLFAAHAPANKASARS